MLTQLRDIVEQVSRVENIHQALDVLVNETCLAMQTECCTVYFANDELQRLELMATKGLTFEGDAIHIDYPEGLVGLVRRSAEPLNLAEASKHPAFKYLPQLGEDIFHSFLGAPIIYRKQVLGVLVIQQKTSRQFSETEESFLVTLSAQLAVLIAHAQAQGHWLINDAKSQTISGVPASPGVAIGQFWWDDNQPQLSEVYPASALDIDKEQEWMALAIEAALTDFRRMRKKFDNEINKDALAIFDLFTHLLNDPMLRKDLKLQIDKRDRADWALRQVIDSYSSRFAQMSDLYLRERAQDFRELGQRLLHFLHTSEGYEQEWKEPVIVVVTELTASMLASMPRDKLLAVVSMEGAANSHAAILSRALGIPAVMGASINQNSLVGKQGIVDGYSGTVFVDPMPPLLQEYQELQVEEHELSALVESELTQRASTQDGCEVEVLLNAGLSADNQIAINQGVDGVGLYRTEISFLLKQRFPSEDEQAAQYKTVLSTYPEQKVVMRTLDVGGDKPLPYLPIEEDNPFLGWRGIRFTLDHPDIFLIQLRAMLRASAGLNNLSILLPMVSGSQELDEAITLIDQAFGEVSQDYPELVRPKIGIMLEVPSILFLLPLIAERIDFVSVGTNDLTQYLLAVDRNNARVSDVYESVHPSVIQALAQIQSICSSYQLPVSICGELAGDPIGALLAVGLGYRSLSMNTSNVARVKYILRQVEIKELQQLATSSLKQAYGKDIHRSVLEYLDRKQLSGFVRAGRY
ncbi:phosphoenolpyruvate--protein phosphotransferase [Vibrio sp. SCSIO 43136]|uniref:phosphoenolpyruvate--protein phosphotransferase n=1 Tax=Vibrio sp. SCSIO 43136 TaxID=2819101 RepID=UPI002075A450|nr:phosphoenolpyruvate--protein phosphotransferase [Vibrio sp. SCSIO 43136]USD64880.1 phosphoenolpyruvate--protein phosphotransferase [Vibrio sp. SCSIO 43136]